MFLRDEYSYVEFEKKPILVYNGNAMVTERM